MIVYIVSYDCLYCAATVFAGTLGIATRGGAMPGFRDFLKSVTPSSQPGSPFIKEFWEISFNCSCPSTVCEPSDHDIENHTHRSGENS